MPTAAWIHSFEEFCEILENTHDSGTGPDHIFYSMWKHAPEDYVRALYNHYCLILSDGTISPNFNDSYMVFLPKGDLDLDVTAQVREPKNARPLNLSNTDNKMTALGIAALSIRSPLTLSTRPNKGVSVAAR